MGGCIASILASHPVAPGSILVIPENFDVAGIHQQRYREESRQRLDNIDWTHLVLARQGVDAFLQNGKTTQS